MRFVSLILLTLFVSPVWAQAPTPPKQALCPECTGKAFTADVGACQGCGTHTSSGAFELCPTCALARGVCQACQKPLGGPQELTLATNDGWKLAATWTPHEGGQSRGGVVLLHMLNRTRADWAPLVPRLTKAGLDVLSIDFRGHGQSARPKSWKEFKDAEFKGLVIDAATAVEALRARPSVAQKPVFLMGGSIGANAAIRLAAQDKSIAGVVALSPGLDYHGVTTEDAIPDLGERPILLVASKDDEYSAETVEKLGSLAKGARRIVYTNAGHGTDMFGKEDAPGALTQAIAEFVESTLNR